MAQIHGNSGGFNSAGEGGSFAMPVHVPFLEDQPDAGNIVPLYGLINIYGRSRSLRDTFCIQTELCAPAITNNCPLHYFSIFDGHGSSEVAEIGKELMHIFLKDELMLDEEQEDAPSVEQKWMDVIDKSFWKTDEFALTKLDSESVGRVCSSNFDAILEGPNMMVGSTALMALLTPDKIIVANCGVSRAVLGTGGGVVPLSDDHRPDRPDELVRIKASGGLVINKDGVAKVMGELTVSRALGDGELKHLVISEPEITFTPRTHEDEFLILASDGLWNFVSNDVACDVVRRCLFGGDAPSDAEEAQLRCDNAAKILVHLAMKEDSMDNITVVVINLKRQ